VAGLKALGFDLEVDKEMGLISIKQFEGCECCMGNVNMCSGEICANLGMCYCIYSYIQDREYTKEMKIRELT
jgi:hypothetical protein